MAIFNRNKWLGGQFIDIIEWLDDSPNTMVWRFERHGNEIKNGAKLVVREGQVAALVHEGQLADVYTPGTHELTTQNMPVLSTLQGWKYGFESPFKSEVYFVTTRAFTDLKWGTKNPIMLRDPEFGPVRLRAFGTYVVRVKDAEAFLKEIVGTNGHFTTGDVTSQLRNMIVARFADVLGESKLPVLDLAANYDELSKFITQRIHDSFAGYGLEVSQLLVENISLPPEVEKALDKRSSMGVLGNLNAYTQYQAAEAMRDAAQNPGAGGAMAAGGMGAGLGFGLGSQMANAMSQGQQQAPQQGGPPPLPQQQTFHVAVNGQQTGPFDANALRQQAQSGQFTRESLVWTQGMAQWTKAGEVEALKPIFEATPPPVPPPPPPSGE